MIGSMVRKARCTNAIAELIPKIMPSGPASWRTTYDGGGAGRALRTSPRPLGRPKKKRGARSSAGIIATHSLSIPPQATSPTATSGPAE